MSRTSVPAATIDPYEAAARQPAHRASLAMYRQRRRVALLLLIIIAGLLPAAALAFTAPARADAVKAPRSSLIVVVSQGETLWDLALAHTPPGQDPLAYLTEVIALNDVQATALQPGTALRLP